MTYGDLTDCNENIRSFLFFTGYLKVKELIRRVGETGEPAIYSLVIPNIEIKSCYKDFENFGRLVDKAHEYGIKISFVNTEGDEHLFELSTVSKPGRHENDCYSVMPYKQYFTTAVG